MSPTQTDVYFWALARNAWGRPVVQHAVTSTSDTHTVCNRAMNGWSRTYTGGPLGILACKDCLRTTGVSISQRRQTVQIVGGDVTG